jgi:cytochrome c-type biogenesis protein CcmH
MRGLTLVVLLLFNGVAGAIVEIHTFDTAEQEARYDKLIAELRCLVCQNQNLADSNAELAQDLRQQTYEMIMQGKSDEEIVAYMVARYGDFVLYRPPFKTSTALLWIGPFVILVVGVLIVLRLARRKQKSEPELDEAERARIRELLESGSQERSP